MKIYQARLLQFMVASLFATLCVSCTQVPNKDNGNAVPAGTQPRVRGWNVREGIRTDTPTGIRPAKHGQYLLSERGPLPVEWMLDAQEEGSHKVHFHFYRFKFNSESPVGPGNQKLDHHILVPADKDFEAIAPKNFSPGQSKTIYIVPNKENSKPNRVYLLIGTYRDKKSGQDDQDSPEDDQDTANKAAKKGAGGFIFQLD